MSESITCPRCGRTSYHPQDVRKRYCGACHAFHDDGELDRKLRELWQWEQEQQERLDTIRDRLASMDRSKMEPNDGKLTF